MNIVLIGMRGVGKTTIGKEVAKKLGRQFIEMDDIIAQKAGMTIAQIVKKHGWKYFRELESEVTKEVCQLDNVVISAGGGVVEQEENIKNLKRKGKTVLLTGSADTLVLRIRPNSKRPLLTAAKTMREDIKTVLQRRDKLYHDAADVIIHTENKRINEVIEEVLLYEHK